MSLQAELEQAFHELHIGDPPLPGVVVAVSRIRGGSRVFPFGYTGDGLTELHDDTLFAVASITKLATALAIHRLVALGSIRLTDPLRNYVPETAADGDGITIARLLAHTSGLPMSVPDDAEQPAGHDWRCPQLVR